MIDVYNLGLFVGYLGYFFLGAYLYDSGKGTFTRSSVAAWMTAFIAAGSATAFLTHLGTIQAGKPFLLFYDYLSPLVVVAAACAFNAFLRASSERSSAPGRLVEVIADCSLGIYCIHVLVMDRLSAWGGLDISLYSAWWAIPAFSMLTLLVSLITVFCMRKVPLLRSVS